MARLPDRFDLWVRRARECPDAMRQADYILGALAAMREWHFLNVGPPGAPEAAKAQIGPDLCRLVYTDAARIAELQENEPKAQVNRVSAITIPTGTAFAWCVEDRMGLFVNPGEDAVLIPFGHLEIYHADWIRDSGRRSAGFWIPNMTTEEEDFWQEHGL